MISSAQGAFAKDFIGYKNSISPIQMRDGQVVIALDSSSETGDAMLSGSAIGGNTPWSINYPKAKILSLTRIEDLVVVVTYSSTEQKTEVSLINDKGEALWKTALPEKFKPGSAPVIFDQRAIVLIANSTEKDQLAKEFVILAPSGKILE